IGAGLAVEIVAHLLPEAALISAALPRAPGFDRSLLHYIGIAGRWPMKIKLDIDCTPEEARTFFGLPDVAPLQAEMMRTIQERMMKTLTTMDPEALLKIWL